MIASGAASPNARCPYVSAIPKRCAAIVTLSSCASSPMPARLALAPRTIRCAQGPDTHGVQACYWDGRGSFKRRNVASRSVRFTCARVVAGSTLLVAFWLPTNCSLAYVSRPSRSNVPSCLTVRCSPSGVDPTQTLGFEKSFALGGVSCKGEAW